MAETIYLNQADDMATLRHQLRQVRNGRALVVLPWDSPLLVDLLESDLLRREAERLGLEVAVVSEDPDRRLRVREAGLPVFGSVDKATAAPSWRGREQEPVAPPPTPWWAEEVKVLPPPVRLLPAWFRHAKLGVRLLIFAATLLFLLATAYVVVPHASIILVPAGQTVSVIVPVSGSADVEAVDLAARLIPARRVGDYFEGNIEIETTGATAYESGRATGSVLFTNLLGQEVTVPVGTLLRTSAGSFPVRFVTTQEVVVPPLGQAATTVEALEDGLVGNVRANQINYVDGIAGFALRVTNPTPTGGGSTQDVRAVSQADMDHARALLREQLLEQAYEGLQAYLEPTEFMPRQSLVVQASETAFNRFLYERADSLGLHMQVLVTGEVMDRDNAETVAYAELVQHLPAGYHLVTADFEVGELAEEPLEAGAMTVFVTANGYAAADLDVGSVWELVRGKPVEEASALLQANLLLAAPPTIQAWPEWLNRLPVIPLRVDVSVLPQAGP